ncbi:MAG: hypothetical protein WAT19_06515 [Ferruginibacter sp.]
MKTLYLYISLLVTGVLLFSCGMQKNEPVSGAEALKLSADIEAAIKNRSEQNIDQMINPEIVADRASKGMQSAFREGVQEGIGKALAKNNLARQIVRSVGKNGSYKMLRQYEKDGIQHLIFRLYSDEGLNYHDFELTKRNGKIWIADIYIYASGENFSKSMADIISNYIGTDKDFDDAKIKQLEKLRDIRTLLNRGDYEKANSIYQSIPTQLRNTRLLDIAYLEIANGLSDTAYKNAVVQFEKIYKNDSGMYLLLIDPYILNKDYKRAMECVEGLDKLLNKDPLLDLFRANIFTMMNRPAEAGAALERLTVNMPAFQDGHIALINYYLENDLKEKSKKAIEQYRGNKAFDQEKLEENSGVYY